MINISVYEVKYYIGKDRDTEWKTGIASMGESSEDAIKHVKDFVPNAVIKTVEKRCNLHAITDTVRDIIVRSSGDIRQELKNEIKREMVLVKQKEEGDTHKEIKREIIKPGKRPVGRPRKYPKDENKPKRPVGRPRKYPKKE